MTGLESDSAAPENCTDGICRFRQVSPSNDDLVSLPPSTCRVIQELGILFQVAKNLQAGSDLRTALDGALKEMATSLGLRRGTLRILNRATGERPVEAFFGKFPEALAPGFEERLAEVEGRVVREGEEIVVPDLHRPGKVLVSREIATASHSDFCPGAVSWLCVPVAYQTEVLGTLSATSSGPGRAAIEADLRLLTLVAQLAAQAVRARQQAREQLEYFRRENEKLQEQIKNHFRPDSMIGNSGAMKTVFHSIEQVATSATTVLIRGESGVGKELVAHGIHTRSPRAQKAFVKVNCAALPESIVESELFGHEKGAFTGAIAMRKGRFELAHRGTIFLDEIGELTLQTQAKLLRVLQEKEFERVGGTETLACDVRVIAATNRSLEDFVEEGKFRQDLYYRLNVFPIYVPALRERKTDILQLADFFVEKYNKANGKTIRRISTPAIDMLMNHHWPGNVRELENCIERASLLATDDVIHGYHLPPTLQMPADNSGQEQHQTLEAAVDAFEREIISDALQAHHGNMAAAARQLGLTERVMGLRVRKHQIEPKSFRE